MAPAGTSTPDDAAAETAIVVGTAGTAHTAGDTAIRLGQLLKLAGVAESGADARALLADGEVEVDGEVETRRGRQVPVGSLVTVAMPTGELRLRVVEAPPTSR